MTSDPRNKPDLKKGPSGGGGTPMRIGLRRSLPFRGVGGHLNRGYLPGLCLCGQFPSPAPEVPHRPRDLVGPHHDTGRQRFAIAPQFEKPVLQDPEEADEIILRDPPELAGDLRAGRVHLQARNLCGGVPVERLFRAADPFQPLDPDFSKPPRANDRKRGDAARPAFVQSYEPPLHRNRHRGRERFYREPAAGHPVVPPFVFLIMIMRNISCSDNPGYFNARIYFERMGEVVLIFF